MDRTIKVLATVTPTLSSALMAFKSSSVIITFSCRSPNVDVPVPAVRLTYTVPVASTKLMNVGSKVEPAILELNSNCNSPMFMSRMKEERAVPFPPPMN